MNTPKAPDTLLRTDGSSTNVNPKNGKFYTLEELYTLLGCEMVEVVYVPNSHDILICDEEGGLVENCLLNKQASLLAGQPIVGDVLRCHTRRFR